MESKNRLLIAFSVTVIILVALFTGVGRNLFNLSTPKVVLPTLTDTTPGVADHQEEGHYLRVEVNPKTVQSAIASLAPSQSYYRQITTTLYWEGGSAQQLAEVWHHQGITQVQKALPTGQIRHDIIRGDQVFYWYDGAATHFTAPSQATTADLAQHIPTYQTVLQLPQDDIIQAGYQEKEGVPCIYVEAVTAPLFFSQHYWVSVHSGLLVFAEIYDGQTLLYQMNGFAPLTSPVPESTTFTLPNGETVEPQETEDQEENQENQSHQENPEMAEN